MSKRVAAIVACFALLFSTVLGAQAASPDPIGAPAAPPDQTNPSRAALVDQLIPLQAALRTKNPEAFGGLWVDDDGVPHVAVVGNASDVRELVLAASLSPAPVLHTARFSERFLNETMDKVKQAINSDPDLVDLDMSWIGPSLPRNAIVVHYVSGTASQLAGIRERFGPAVAFEETTLRMEPVACTRTNCPNPLKAGLQLYKASNLTACMSSFVMYSGTSYWLMSAGHCFDSGWNYRYHPAGTSIGTTWPWFHQVQTPVDAMLISISSSQAGNNLFVTSSLIRSVTSSEATQQEVVGETVCSSKLSGVSCGYLQEIGVCTSYGVCDQRLASGQYACGGDSGSPVYMTTGSTTAKAVGIIVAGTGSTTCGYQGSQSVYTHIQLVSMVSGTYVKTS